MRRRALVLGIALSLCGCWGPAPSSSREPSGSGGAPWPPEASIQATQQALDQVEAPVAEKVTACAARDATACWMLGMFYSNGMGVEQSSVEAERHFRLACDLESPEGCSSLALIVDDLPGGSRAESLRLSIRACELGASINCTLAAEALSAGAAGPSDPVRAVSYLKRGCELQAASDACIGLSAAYRDGRGVPSDIRRAHEVLRGACDAEYPPACFNLAVYYQNGVGVPKSMSTAAGFYERACRGNFGDACAALAGMFAIGSGVPLDRRRAEALLAQSCKLGHSEGCSILEGVQASGWD